MKENDMDNKLGLSELLKYLQKKLWIILASTAALALVGLLYSLIFIPKEYTSSTRIYVLNRTNENTVVSADYQTSNYMVNDYRELIKGRNVTQQVIKKLGLKMSTGKLAGMISVNNPQNTRFLQISVTDTDPDRARQIADTVREVAAEQLTELLKVDSVTTIYTAGTPSNPSSPDVSAYTRRFALMGLVISSALFVMIFLIDDRIRTEEHVEKYLGLSIMGVIPDRDMLLQKGSPRKNRLPLGKSKGRGIRQWK